MTADRTVLPCVEPSPVFRFPDVERQVLSNGIRLWTIDHRETKLVTFLLLLSHGSSADPKHREGLAALTADLLDDGAGNRSGFEIHEALGRIGGTLGTDVTSDATVLSITALSRFESEAISLLIDIATCPRFESKEIERVRELRQHRLAQMNQVPSIVADRTYLEAIFGDHPYGHFSIGTETSISSITNDEVRAFHSTYFGPRQWTVIGVGASSTRFRELAEEKFGAISFGTALKEPLEISEPVDPVVSKKRLIVVPRPGSAQSEIRLGHLGASRNIPDFHALLVLNMTLGGQFVSRLNLNLREDKGYTYGVGTTFDCRRGRGPFVLHAAVQSAATADALRESINEISAIREKRPVSESELTAAKAALTNGFSRNFETQSQLARAAMRLSLFQLPDDYFTEFCSRVAAVDVGTVMHAASMYLQPEKFVAVIVGSPDEFESDLEGLGFGAPVEQ